MDPRLRGLLVCPRCRGELELLPSAIVVPRSRTGTPRAEATAEEELRCAACRARWPVVDGVPWLVEEVARRDPGAP